MTTRRTLAALLGLGAAAAVGLTTHLATTGPAGSDPAVASTEPADIDNTPPPQLPDNRFARTGALRPGDVELAANCLGPDEIICLGTALAEHADTTDPGAALTLLSRWAAADTQIAAECHDIQHVLAQQLVATHDVADLIGYDDRSCLSGYLHGVVEGFGLTADDTEFWARIGDVCVGLDPDTSQRTDCAHGAGHAISVRNIGGVAEALDHCTLLDQRDIGVCAGAVIMAYSNGEAIQNQALTVELDRPDPNDMIDICNTADPATRGPCWLSMWQFHPPERTTTELAPIISDACTRTVDDDSYRNCIQGLGTMMFFRTPGDRPIDAEPLTERVVELVDRCGTGPEADPCVTGVAYAALNWWMTQDNHPDLFTPCDAVDSGRQVACRDGEADLRARTN